MNNTYAMKALGFMYEIAKGVEFDCNKAKEYYEKAAKLKDIYSYVNLAGLYMNGNGFKHDYPKAKYYLEISASKKNRHAMYRLGMMHKKGYGTKKDLNKAIHFFEEAAEQNQNNALYQLGNCYFKGKGKAQDYSKAKRYYEKSASQGDSKAFYKLGILYDKGLGVTKDPNKAILNYISAALKKNYCAIYILAKHYLNGDNCEFNIKKSIDFFTECIETKGENIIQELNGYYNYCINYNYYPANNYLAVIYLTMFDKPDIDLARKYLGETLFGEYPPGQNNFGLFSEIYLKNECNAEEVYKKAAKNKFSLSEFNLGHMYEKCGKLED